MKTMHAIIDPADDPGHWHMGTSDGLDDWVFWFRKCSSTLHYTQPNVSEVVKHDNAAMGLIQDT